MLTTQKAAYERTGSESFGMEQSRIKQKPRDIGKVVFIFKREADLHANFSTTKKKKQPQKSQSDIKVNI